MRQLSVSLAALASSLMLLPGCAQAIAQETPQSAEQDQASPIEIPDQYKRQIHRDKMGFLSGRINDLYRYSSTGTVTAADVATFRAVDVARRRSSLLGQYLAFDLDGNGAVTRVEFDQVPVSVNRNGKSKLDLGFATADPNEDGALDFEELTALAEEEVQKFTDRRQRFDDSPMMFDQNGDGQVDAAEVTAVVEAIAAEPEPEPVRPERIRPVREPVADCKLPEPGQKADVVVVSGFTGPAISTVAVNGLNQVTTVATMKIEPGKTPLYIFALSRDPVVWKLDGDVGRVERFVAQPSTTENGPGTAVAGLPAAKVSFVAPASCGEYVSDFQREEKATNLKNIIGKATGKPVSSLVTGYKLNGITVPSGKNPPLSTESEGPSVVVEKGRYFLKAGGVPEFVAFGDPKGVQMDFERMYPAGTVKFDPGKLVASAPVQSYDVLPGEAGLLQLMKTGALKLGPKGQFYIEKPIARFPAGLLSSRRIQFVLRKGVPLPEGSIGLKNEFGECVGPPCKPE